MPKQKTYKIYKSIKENNTNELDKTRCTLLPTNSIMITAENNSSKLKIKFVKAISKTKRV